MKRILFMIAFLLSMTVMAQQPTIGFGTNEARYVGEDVIVPILIANMPPINIISLGVEFNSNAITYIEGVSTAVTPWLVFHVEPSIPNRLMMGGFVVGESITIPDGVLGYVKFRYKKHESPLKFITNFCEFAVKSPTGGAPIKVAGINYTNGWVLPVVDIAGKTWMARNAVFGSKITATQQQSNNGTAEYHSLNDTLWGGYYKWDEVMNYNTTAGSQGVCPTGWHVPTIDEFATLVRANLPQGETFVYFPQTDPNTAAKKLKAVNDMTIKNWKDRAWTYHAKGGQGDGTSGFNAIGGGYFKPGVNNSPGIFAAQGQSGVYWTSEIVPFATYNPAKYSNTPGEDPVGFQFYYVDHTVRIVTLKRSDSHYSLRCVKN